MLVMNARLEDAGNDDGVMMCRCCVLLGVVPCR